MESKVDSCVAAALKIRHMCPDELDINQVNSWGQMAVHIASCIGNIVSRYFSKYETNEGSSCLSYRTNPCVY